MVESDRVRSLPGAGLERVPGPPSAAIPNRLRQLGWAIVLIVGALQALAGAHHQSMNPDGVAYLDLADALLRDGWPAVVNGYWSPVYPSLLGAVLGLLDPAPRWEFPLVHAVNFLIYVTAFACFHFFWIRLTRWNLRRDELVSGWAGFPAWAWLVLGYALFLWSTTVWIKVWSVTPDLLVAALLFLAAGLLTGIGAGRGRWTTFTALGVVLGLGYLSKAAIFPLAAVFLGVACLAHRGRGNRARLVAVAAAAFLVVAGPLVAALSLSKGRLTFGEAGGLNYAWYVNGIPRPHWQGPASGSDRPEHPTRQVSADPPIYEFDGPVGGTYPPWFDPSHWYEGVRPRFDLGQQLVVLRANLLVLLDLLLRQQAAPVTVVALLWLAASGRRRPPGRWHASWFLIVPALAAMALYSLVLVETRYLGGFLVLLWGGVLTGIRLPRSSASVRVLAAAAVAVAAVVLISLGLFNLGEAGLLRAPDPGHAAPSPFVGAPRGSPLEIATALGQLGLRPGDRVGVIGYGFDSFWARLARVRIVAELYPWEAPGLWDREGGVRSRVIESFAATGARAVVAEQIDPGRAPEGWLRIGASNHFLRWLDD